MVVSSGFTVLADTFSIEPLTSPKSRVVLVVVENVDAKVSEHCRPQGSGGSHQVLEGVEGAFRHILDRPEKRRTGVSNRDSRIKRF